MENKYLYLQLFAEGVSTVNTTTGSVNAASGEKEDTTAMSGELKAFYDTESNVDRVNLSFLRKLSSLPVNSGSYLKPLSAILSYSYLYTARFLRLYIPYIYIKHLKKLLYFAKKIQFC